MAQSVRDRLELILAKETGKSPDQANELLEDMKLENRYVEEIFGLHAWTSYRNWMSTLILFWNIFLP